MWQPIYHEFRRWAKISRLWAAAGKRTEIIVETDRILIIRKARATRAWCAECGREVDMVKLHDAGALLGGDAQVPQVQPVLPGSVDGRGWHWSETVDGTPLICLESLLRSK